MSAASSVSLVKQLVLRDLALRYRSTLLGFFWSLVKPVALIALFYVVFEKILNVRQGMAGLPDEVNYGLFLSTGIITWTFFSSALSQGVSTYLNNHHLLSRAMFWRPALPLAATISQWIHYLFAQAILVLILGFAGGHGWGAQLLLLIPLSVVELILAASVVWILAGFQVLARDTAQFLEIALMVGFYASPILYPAELALSILDQHHLGFLYLLNPLAPLLMLRQAILLWDVAGGTLWQEGLGPSPVFVVIALAETAVLLYLAVRLNRKLNRTLVDRL